MRPMRLIKRQVTDVDAIKDIVDSAHDTAHWRHGWRRYVRRSRELRLPVAQRARRERKAYHSTCIRREKVAKPRRSLQVAKAAFA